MLVPCRPRPCRLTALCVFHVPAARSTSTSTSTSQPQDSIFTAPESPWDHVFSDTEPDPPRLSPAQRLRTRLRDGANANASTGPVTPSGHQKGQGLVRRSSVVKHQRASLTAREMSVFDDMFDLIFNAMSAREAKSSGSGSGSGPSSFARASSLATPAAAPYVPPGQTPSIGRAGAATNDLFRTLRRHTSRVRWTTAIDEELDRKKETMELFSTDYELLQWVTMELFGESQQWDEEAKRAIAASSAGAAKQQGSEGGTTGSSTDAAPPSSSSGLHTQRPINHSIYPHLIAHAMRIFRTTYSNPSLSLAIFNHAARASIPSYVFGCTAPAYNELIEAKWEGWGDLEGVCNALEEMRANGVKIDGRTRIVVEKVRREVGEARPEACGEPSSGEVTLDDATAVNPLARKVWGELGDVEVMRLLHRIERLALRDRSRTSTSSPHEESWKSAVLRPAEDDGWTFDSWDRKVQRGRNSLADRTAFR